MKIGWRTGAVLCMGVVGCVGSRGSEVSDAGQDALDAPMDSKEAGKACPQPSGGNDVSFDLVCTGGTCDVNTTLDFHLDTTSAAYPGCGDGQRNLELANLNVRPPALLKGSQQSLLAIGVTEYTGPGAYTLQSTTGNEDLLFELSATPACEGDAGGNAFLTLLIQNTPTGSGGSDGGGGAEAGVTPYCDVKVETDCTDGDGTHTVGGTFSCSFENAGGGQTCKLTHGKFELGHCVP